MHWHCSCVHQIHHNVLLGRNSIGNEGAQCIGAALSTNTSITGAIIQSVISMVQLQKVLSAILQTHVVREQRDAHIAPNSIEIKMAGGASGWIEEFRSVVATEHPDVCER